MVEKRERERKNRQVGKGGGVLRSREGCGLTLDMALLRVGLGTAEFLAPKRRFMMSG